MTITIEHAIIMEYISVTYYDSMSNVVAMHSHKQHIGKILFVANLLNHGIRDLEPDRARRIAYAIYTVSGHAHAHVYDRTNIRVRSDGGSSAGWVHVNTYVPEDPEVIAELNLVFDKGDQ